MNKRLLLLSAALVSLAATSNGQITLTAANNSPQAGFTSTIYATTNATPAGNSGANQIWDFSALPSGTTLNDAYTTCAATPNCSMFPGSNIASTDGSGSYGYLITNSTSLKFNGAYAGGTAIVYSDPEDFFRFPFTYNNSFADSFKASFTSGGMPYYRRGNDTTTADGWGKLILPNATFNNTLRVKRVQTYRDSLNLGGTATIINYKVIIYTWYAVNTQEYLLNLTSISVTGFGAPSTSYTTRYTSQQPVGVAGVSAMEATLKVFPNPANDVVNISFSGNGGDAVQVSLTDVTGRVVATQRVAATKSGEQKVSFPTSNLSKGLYFAVVQSNGSHVTRKIEIQ